MITFSTGFNSRLNNVTTYMKGTLKSKRIEVAM